MKASRTKKGNVKVVLNPDEAREIEAILAEGTPTCNVLDDLYDAVAVWNEIPFEPKVFKPVDDPVLELTDADGVVTEWLPKPANERNIGGFIADRNCYRLGDGEW